MTVPAGRAGFGPFYLHVGDQELLLDETPPDPCNV
jgi:hypothetical protein